MASTDVSFGIYTKTFAHITSANRIHLWDVDSRKEKRGYVDRNHLSHSFSCFTRKEQSHSNSANGSNDINDNKKSLGLLGVGFSDGLVIIWDLVRGVVAQTIGKVNETPVPTDICFSNDLTSVFIGYQDSKLLQYNVQTGGLVKSYKAGKKGISKLAINPKVGVIAVARSVIISFNSAHNSDLFCCLALQ